MSLKVLLLSLMWAYFIYFCWQLDPGPIAYVPCTILGLLVAGWPLYIPIIRRFLVKSPILVVDTASKLIHVARLRKDFKLDDLYAVCDVVGPDGDGLKCRRELQLVLQMSGGFEFVLVSKSIRDIFGPIAKELASFAETRHLSVDILAGTVIESSTVWTDDRSTKSGKDARCRAPSPHHLACGSALGGSTKMSKFCPEGFQTQDTLRS